MLIAGCDDQMIADLITARRQRPHTDKPKWQDEKKGILRADYYRKTIAKAKTWTVKAQAQQRLAGRFGGGDSGSWVVDATPTGGAAASPPDDLKAGRERKETLDDISVIFGLRVVQIIKILSDPPSYTYTVTTEKGSFLVGRAHELITQTKLRDLIAEHSGYYLRPMKAGDWASIAQGMLHIVEERESGVEATEQGGLHVWVENYLVAREQRRMDTLKAFGTLMPFVHSNGKIYIGLDAFKK